MNPGMGNKYASKRALEEIRGDKRVTDTATHNSKRKRIDGDAGGGAADESAAKSSAAFFAKLQKQTQIEIASKSRQMMKQAL